MARRLNVAAGKACENEPDPSTDPWAAIYRKEEAEIAAAEDELERRAYEKAFGD